MKVEDPDDPKSSKTEYINTLAIRVQASARIRPTKIVGRRGPELRRFPVYGIYGFSENNLIYV